MEIKDARIGAQYKITAGGYMTLIGNITLARVDADDSRGSGYFTTPSGVEIWKLFKNVEPAEVPKTPAEDLGMEIGKQYVVTEPSRGWFKDGAIITFVDDDRSTIPAFTGEYTDSTAASLNVANGTVGRGYHHITSLKPYVKQTPAEKAELVVGGIYRLTESYMTIAMNTQMEMIADNKDFMPKFKLLEGKHEGARVYIDIKRVGKEKTPRQKLGYKLGDKFKAVSGANCRAGEVFTLHRDDGTAIPYFKDGKGNEFIEMLYAVKPYVEPVKVAPEVVFMSLPHKTFIEVMAQLTDAQKEAVRKAVA